jgi:arylsulfatase A-like enzyme
LLVRWPGEVEAGLRVGALTQAIDLAPTLAELFGGSLAAAHGHSLLPFLRGEAGAERPYVCSGLEIGGEVEWALRTPEWAFLLPRPQSADTNPRGPALYVKPDDRHEVNNVVQHQLERAEELEKALRAFVAATAEPGPLWPPPLVERPEPIAPA